MASISTAAAGGYQICAWPSNSADAASVIAMSAATSGSSKRGARSTKPISAIATGTKVNSAFADGDANTLTSPRNKAFNACA